MLLVFEIALGVLLGGLILANFRVALRIGLYAVGAVAAYAVSVGLIALVQFLWGSSSGRIVLSASILLVVAFMALWWRFSAKLKIARIQTQATKLTETITQREALGYESPELLAERLSLQDQLKALLEASKFVDDPAMARLRIRIPLRTRIFGSAAERESARRKLLGYDQ